ncbi:hypothetical protein [Sphingobacterium hotanense]|uniref:Lipoprotein n=1 Tax=Sphingobacterium hotanense TaxID=649196 RepID=A0ABT7NP19_9SPHI|nr:hypothetical protein [Sphingobacterium hotanense]MDM1048999.1 hypothetical protein [Sphingobacterium hotanense]
MIRPIFFLFIALVSLVSCNDEKIDPIGLRMDVDLLQGKCGLINMQIKKDHMIQDFRGNKCEPNITSEYSTLFPEERYKELIGLIEELDLMSLRKRGCNSCSDGKDIGVKINYKSKTNQFTIGLDPEADNDGKYKKFVEFVTFYMIFESEV